MSYILDALRRADAERARGAVPGLHAQNAPADSEPAARNFNPLIWAAGAAGVLVVAVVVVLVFGPWRSVPNPAPAPDARVTLAPAPAPAPELAAARDNVPAPSAQGEVTTTRSPPAAPPSRPVARDPSADRTSADRTATLASTPDARTPTAAAQPPIEHYGAPITATPASAPVRGNAVPSINDLPPNVRSQLPHLAVGGAIFSETPAARMVILNGQVWHEGEKPAADTVLEQIRLKSAVLNFRGQRYEVAF